MEGSHVNGTDLWTMSVIVGLAAVTVLTRCFFFILDRPWALPHWAERALQYAPVAALAGVIAPEIVMQSGQLVATLRDARLYAAPVGALLFFWRRSVLLTIAGGMAVYLPLHLGLGW
jgi:branched-subunit amino acid transport protein